MTRRGQGWLAAIVIGLGSASAASAAPLRLACHGSPPMVDRRFLGEDDVNPPSSRLFDFVLAVDSAGSTVSLDGGLPFFASFSDERIVFTLPKAKGRRGVWGKAERLILKLKPGVTITLNRKTGAFSARDVEGLCRRQDAPNQF